MVEITIEIAPQDKKWSTAMEMMTETIKKIRESCLSNCTIRLEIKGVDRH
nr:hypothetical protein [Mitsuokella multacida]